MECIGPFAPHVATGSLWAIFFVKHAFIIQAYITSFPYYQSFVYNLQASGGFRR